MNKSELNKKDYDNKLLNLKINSFFERNPTLIYSSKYETGAVLLVVTGQRVYCQQMLVAVNDCMHSL